VVRTSSTSSTRNPSSRIPLFTEKAPRTFALRFALVNPACGFVARVRRATVRTGTFHRRAISRRKQCRLMNPRSQRLRQCSGIGTIASKLCSLGKAFARNPPNGRARGCIFSYLKRWISFPKRPFVRTVRIQPHRTGKPQPAHCASPGLIQGKRVHTKGVRQATQKNSAVIARRFMQTTAANGDAGNFVEGLAADAALIREDELEQAAQRPFRGARNAIGQNRRTFHCLGSRLLEKTHLRLTSPVYNAGHS